MKAEEIIVSMNDIKDDYVAEYAEKARTAKAEALCRFRTWGIVAACLALVFLCTPALIHIFNPSGIDDPQAGARYEFGSYTELCSALPEGNVIAKIPDGAGANISAYVECPEGTTDFADYNNYSYLAVDVSYDDGTGVSIFSVVKSEKTAKEDIDSKPLSYPPEKVSMTTVSGCDIYYTGYDNGTDKVNVAVFSIDGSLYKISTVALSPEELIRYIGDMLHH